METIRQLLRKKGHTVWSVSPDATVYEALQLMAEKDIGAVLVMDGETLVGILSERDYARKVLLHDRTSRETRVDEIMTREVVCASPEQSLEEAMALMAAHHIRHLPVLEEGDRVVGIVSISDVVKAVISDQTQLISHLQAYILGKRA